MFFVSFFPQSPAEVKGGGCQWSSFHTPGRMACSVTCQEWVLDQEESESDLNQVSEVGCSGSTSTMMKYTS